MCLGGDWTMKNILLPWLLCISTFPSFPVHRSHCNFMKGVSFFEMPLLRFLPIFLRCSGFWGAFFVFLESSGWVRNPCWCETVESIEPLCVIQSLNYRLKTVFLNTEKKGSIAASSQKEIHEQWTKFEHIQTFSIQLLLFINRHFTELEMCQIRA